MKWISEAYLESSPTCKTKLFAELVHGWVGQQPTFWPTTNVQTNVHNIKIREIICNIKSIGCFLYNGSIGLNGLNLMKRDGYEKGWSCKQYSRILNSRNSLIRFYCDILVKHISCKYHTQVYINHKMLNIVLTYNFGQFKTVEIIRALWCKNMFCCVRLHCASLCSSHTQNRLLQWNRGVLLSEIFHHYKNCPERWIAYTVLVISNLILS